MSGNPGSTPLGTQFDPASARFDAYMRAESDNWGKLLREAGIKAL